MAHSDEYFLGYRREEQQRLQEQGQLLADEANSLFDQIGLRSGASVVEIGCGPRGCLDCAFRRNGPPIPTVMAHPRSEAA